MFFNSRTRPRVNRVLRNQVAGDVLNLVAYRLRCKHYFCHLTRPPSYSEYSCLISTLGRYLRNAGKVGWMGIRLASVYCMTQLLLRVQKPLSLTLRYAHSAGRFRFRLRFRESAPISPPLAGRLVSQGAGRLPALTADQSQ